MKHISCFVFIFCFSLCRLTYADDTVAVTDTQTTTSTQTATSGGLPSPAAPFGSYGVGKVTLGSVTSSRSPSVSGLATSSTTQVLASDQIKLGAVSVMSSPGATSTTSSAGAPTVMHEESTTATKCATSTGTNTSTKTESRLGRVLIQG